MDGILIIDKPAVFTSHDVVDEVRHILHVRRVGHTGTLDPFATGVLVMLIGRATRLAQFLSGLEKEYEGVIRLGYATDTGDLTGHRIDSKESGPARPWSAQQIKAALLNLRGQIEQVPPMYSAKKQDGRKLYELARQGKDVERKPVRVCIYEFEPLRPTAELLKDNRDGTFDFEVRVTCSSGTYVRTLAEDFGKHLGVGAHLAELRRTRVGDFQLHKAKTLADMKIAMGEKSLGTIMYKPDEALSRLPFVDLGADEVRRMKHGLNVSISNADWDNGERVRMRDEAGNLVAIGVFVKEEGSLHPTVVMAVDN
ncbi:MAG: tRNA pseudouridine(55) synthase TruB [Pyrinomonadaceae bacterium]